MTDLFQLGQHPDADQLNAFVEHTLPAHEREQTLAHLAICADCRQIVALSLPPLEELPVAELEPVASPRFGGWFSGWRLAWIAAPALAALVFLTVHLQDSARDRRRVAQPAQVAEVHPPAPTAAAPSKSEAAAVKAPAASASLPAAAAKARKPSPSRAEPVVESAPVSGRELALDKAPPPPPGQSIGGPIAASGTSPGMGATSAQNATGVAQLAPAAPPAKLSLRSAPAASEAPPAASAKAAPAADAVILAGNLTDNAAVSYAGSARHANSFTGLSAVGKSAFASVLAPLPSGQPIVYYAADLHQRVAIDAHHNLFRSEDEGRHWKQVSAPWQGHAIAVATILPAASHPNSLAFAVPERFKAGAVASAQSSAQSDAAGSSLSGTVTDAAGAAIAGATVVIKESRYALARTEKADAAGHYLFANLAPGSYRIDVQAPGFVKQTLVENLAPSQQAVRNLVLSVGQTSETVTVDAASVQIETQPVNTAATVDKAKSADVRSGATPTPSIFVVTTDKGDHWTSSDGLTWKHE